MSYTIPESETSDVMDSVPVVGHLGSSFRAEL
jgi:hypothetical protein